MEYVIGWITVKPGMRETFLAAARPFLIASQTEPGVLFFELHASAAVDDLVIALEGYADSESHERHLKTDHFVVFWTDFQRYVTEGKFENVFAKSHRIDQVRGGE